MTEEDREIYRGAFKILLAFAIIGGALYIVTGGKF